MVNKIQIAHLRNDELIQFLPQLRAQFNGTPGLPSSVTALLDELAALETQLDQLYKRDSAKELTQKALEQDATRDHWVRKLFLLADLYTGDPDAPLDAAGRALAQVLGKYGTSTAIVEAGMNAETAIINNILGDLARPDMAGTVAALDLDRWLTPLRAANAAVDNTLLERAAANAVQELPFNMKEKRVAVRGVYTRLLDKVRLFADEHGNAEPWPALAGRINAITADYERLIAARKGRSAARKEAQPA